MTDPTSVPMFPTPPEDHALRGRVIDALLDGGFEPTIDEDGDVAVVVQEQRVFLRCVESSPPMVRVFGQWLIGDDLPGGELMRLRASNALTGALNLLKVTIHDDRLIVAVDLVVGPDLPLMSLIAASIDAVVGSVHTWHQTVLEMGDPTAG